MRRVLEKNSSDVGKESPPAVNGSAPETQASVAARAEVGQEKEEAEGAKAVSTESGPGAGRAPARRRMGPPRRPRKRLPRARLAAPEAPGPAKKSRAKPSAAASSKRLWIGMF
jgi:hypothetical protein